MYKGKKAVGGGRAPHAVRPVVEAVLVAAVAFGCAHAGWALIAPSSAGASSRTTSADEDASAHAAIAAQPAIEMLAQSPFDPAAGDFTGASHAASAMVAGLQLQGVRVSTDVSRSSAIFGLADGTQRAFSIGQGIGDGVTLAEVTPDHVRVSYAGGERRLDMPARPASIAAAFMGGVQEPVAQRLQLSSADLTPSTPFQAAVIAPAAAKVHVEPNAAEPGHWEVSQDMAPLLQATGLRAGDVIIAVNGTTPPRTATELLAAAQGGPLQVTLRRNALELTVPVSAPLQ